MVYLSMVRKPLVVAGVPSRTADCGAGGEAEDDRVGAVQHGAHRRQHGPQAHHHPQAQEEGQRVRK